MISSSFVPQKGSLTKFVPLKATDSSKFSAYVKGTKRGKPQRKRQVIQWSEKDRRDSSRKEA